MTKQFDRSLCEAIRTDLRSCLLELSKKHGVTISLRGGSWKPERMTTGIEATTAGGPAGTILTPPRASGLTQQDIGSRFQFGNTSYELVGFREARGRNCWIERIPDRKRFVARPEHVRAALGK